MGENSSFNSPSFSRRQHEVDGSWKAFLKPLKNYYNPLPSGLTFINKRASIPFTAVSQKSLVGRFMKQLAKEHEDRSSEKLKNEAKQDLHRLLEKRNLDFEDLDKQWKNFERASKSDREKSGSMWTIEMLKWYIKREDTAFVLPKSSCDLTGETLDEICRRVDLAIKVVCGRHGTVEDLDELHFQPNSTECNTRMIIDAILQPLSVYKGLTLRSEQTIKSTYLPTCRFDYIMYWEVDQPIGVMEAKLQGYLKGDSVAQLLAC